MPISISGKGKGRGKGVLTLRGQINAAPQIGPVPPLVIGQEQPPDLEISSWHRHSAIRVSGLVPLLIVAASQFNPEPAQSQIFKPARSSTVRSVPAFINNGPQQVADVASQLSAPLRGARPNTIPLLIGGPQQVDLTQQSVLTAPLITSQGKTPPLLVGKWQDDPTQSSSLWPSVRTPPTTTGVVRPLIVVPEQAENKQDPIVWASLRSGSKPQSAAQLWVGPQADPYQIASSIWSSARTPPAAASGFIPKFTLGGPEAADLDIESWTRQPSLSGGRATVSPLLVAAPQFDPTVVPGQVWPSLRSPPAATSGPVPPITIAPPQVDPTQIPSQIWKAIQIGGTVPTSFAVRQQFAAPQVDTTQIASQVWWPLTDQGAGLSSEYRYGVDALALYSAETGKTQVWRSIMGGTPPVPKPITALVSAPQDDPTQLPSQVWASQRAGQRPPVIGMLVGKPQDDPTQIPSLTWPSVRTPPAILGTTVSPIPPVPPQFDPSGNPTVLWTPSTFSPSAPVPVVEPTVQSGGVRHKLQRKKKFARKKNPEAVAVVELIAAQIVSEERIESSMGFAIGRLAIALKKEKIKALEIFNELLVLQIQQLEQDRNDEEDDEDWLLLS